MKKSFITLLIMLVILGGWMTASSAASLGVTATNTNPTVGSSITVTVRFSQPVTTASFTLSYNSSVLTYTGNNADGVDAGGRIVYDYIDSKNLSQISSASFNFTTKAVGTSSCSVSNITISDANGDEVPATGGSVSIQVKAKQTDSGNTGSGSKPDNGSNTGSNSKPSNDNKKPTFTSTNQKVYATETVTIRESWSTSSKRLGTLQKDASITRTGIGSNGWDKVSYNGKVAYINHSYLTTTKPKEKDDKKDEDKNNTTNEVNNKVENTTNNEVSNNTINNQENVEQNNTLNDIVNNEANIDNQEENKKKESKGNIMEIVIIGVIVVAIIVIIATEVANQRKKNKRGKRVGKNK